MAFMLIGLVPSIIIEYFIFPFLPFLDIPIVEWAKVFGIETEETYVKPYFVKFKWLINQLGSE